MHDAKLIWVTPDAEELLCYIARVSNPENQSKEPGSLIKYLIKNKHWSPFEMVSMCVEINTTRTIGRQWLRHNPRPQEFSQRYEEPGKLGNFVFTEARLQDEKNRQASNQTDDQELIDWWNDVQTEISELVSLRYKEAMKRKLAKELARNILPEGMTPTKMYFNGNLRDWLFAIDLRAGHGTQLEATDVAKSLHQISKEVFPLTHSVFFNQDHQANQQPSERDNGN